MPLYTTGTVETATADTAFDTKGDIIIGTGADAGAKLVAGANDTMLMADSAQTTGVKWANPATVKTALSLGSVNNTTDAAKPVSIATQTALDLKANATNAVLVTPNLGTPSAGVLTNCTGTAAGLTAGSATLAASATILANTRTINGTSFNGSANITTGSPITVKVTAADYTIGTTSSLELYGGVIYVTSAATITIPAVVAGMNFSVVTIGAIAVSVDPNASDLILRDGTAQADGEKVTNLSTAGDIAVFSYYDATGWFASTNAWTNGG